MKNLINTAIVSGVKVALNGNPIANLVLHITQLHCPVNANTITERIGNISEVFATEEAKIAKFARTKDII
jgi:hypothetical protein